MRRHLAIKESLRHSFESFHVSFIQTDLLDLPATQKLVASKCLSVPVIDRSFLVALIKSSEFLAVYALH